MNELQNYLISCLVQLLSITFQNKVYLYIYSPKFTAPPPPPVYTSPPLTPLQPFTLPMITSLPPPPPFVYSTPQLPPPPVYPTPLAEGGGGSLRGRGDMFRHAIKYKTWHKSCKFLAKFAVFCKKKWNLDLKMK